MGLTSRYIDLPISFYLLIVLSRPPSDFIFLEESIHCLDCSKIDWLYTMQSPTQHSIASPPTTTSTKECSPKTYDTFYVDYKDIIRQLRSSSIDIRYSCMGMRICSKTGNLIQCWKQSRLTNDRTLLRQVAARLDQTILNPHIAFHFYKDLRTSKLLCEACCEKTLLASWLSLNPILKDWDNKDTSERREFFVAVEAAYKGKLSSVVNDIGNVPDIRADSNSIEDGSDRPATSADDTLPSAPRHSHLDVYTPISKPMKRPVSAGSIPFKMASTQFQYTAQTIDGYTTGKSASSGGADLEKTFSQVFGDKPDPKSADTVDFTQQPLTTQRSERRASMCETLHAFGASVFTKSSPTSIRSPSASNTGKSGNNINSQSQTFHNADEGDALGSPRSESPASPSPTLHPQEEKCQLPTRQRSTSFLNSTTKKSNQDDEPVPGRDKAVSALFMTEISPSSSQSVDSPTLLHPLIEDPAMDIMGPIAGSSERCESGSLAYFSSPHGESPCANRRTLAPEVRSSNSPTVHKTTRNSQNTTDILRFKILQMSKIPRDIDNDLRDELLQGTVREGFAYVLQAPKHFQDKGLAPLVKIGYAKNVAVRIKDLYKNCKIEGLEQVSDDQAFAHALYEKTEKLAHVELSNFQRKWLCDSCKVLHGEWFEVAPEVAVQVVQRWRKFLENVPYTNSGILQSPWASLLERSGMPFSQKEELVTDHDSRNERWEKWIEKGSAMSRELCGAIWVDVIKCAFLRHQLVLSTEIPRNLFPLFSWAY